MIIFNHIPRTAGTFLIKKLRATDLVSGPRIRFGAPLKWIPEILCNADYRPVMLVYHTSGAEFARTYERRPGDFVFTFLRNRIDMAYSNFAYMKRRIERGDELGDWTDIQRQYFCRTIEEHIDTILNYHEPDKEYPSDLAIYDFVGITERMNLSLSALSRILQTSLSNDELVNSVPSEKTYRRGELKEKFAAQQDLYRRAEAALLSSSERRVSSESRAGS
jgi:hypothetical protein